MNKLENLLEDELRLMFAGLLSDCVISGKTLIGKADKVLLAKIAWGNSYDNFDAVNVHIINRVSGEIDSQSFRLVDLWGKRKTPYGTGWPHICLATDGTYKWYCGAPSNTDRDVLRAAVRNYINLFRR